MPDTLYDQLKSNRADITTAATSGQGRRAGRWWPIFFGGKEVTYKRNITFDYPSLHAAFCVDDYGQPAIFNVALGFRFGICLLALLLFCPGNEAIRREVARVLEMIGQERGEQPRLLRVEGDEFVIRIKRDAN
jgi:hypothetical protein